LKINDLVIPSHNLALINTASCTPSQNLFNAFFVPFRQLVFSNINIHAPDYPHIDFDLIRPQLSPILATLSDKQTAELRALGVGSGSISAAAWNKDPERNALMSLLWHYPHFGNLICNVHPLAKIAVLSAEIHLGQRISTANFVHAKQFIDEISRKRWTREQEKNEQQSGVSNLGGISELLLALALEELIDETNFFRTGNPKVQSYGDFVLMCLPNNLWLSVKSNFARERLLASGYTTDILGVGFFTSFEEFVSPAKIRNFQRVGFLAMYLPEIPISESQVRDNTNTYQQIVDHYSGQDKIPCNINGSPFLRPLSQLHEDLQKLLAVEKLANRNTFDL